MKFFRVEDRTAGTGPYTTGPQGAAPSDSSRAPSFSRMFWPSMVFGFASREQFVRWFSLEECQLLDAAGFVLAEYEAEGYADECQAVFDKSKAVLVGTEGLARVWNREVVDEFLS